MSAPIDRRRLVWPALALAALAAGMYTSWRTGRLSEPDGGETAAINTLLAQPLQDANNQLIDRSVWEGRSLVLNFWATWCPPCVEEMPELSQLADEIKTDSIEVIGIGIDSAANIRQFALKHRISYPLPVIGAAGIDIVRALGNSAGGLPFTVVVDPKRAVTARFLGRLDMRTLREHLRQHRRTR